MAHPIDPSVTQQSDASPPHSAGDVAWQHPATRRAWTVDLAQHLLGVPLGIGAAGTVIVNLPTPTWVSVILIVLLVIAGIIGICRQAPLVRRAFRLRRILRTYPWEVHERGLPHAYSQRHSAHRGRPWFQFPDPDAPESWVMVYLDQDRHTRWWVERMSPQAGPEAKADIRTLWFVGDPRFCAILAVPGKRGPHRMLEIPRQGTLHVGAEIYDNSSPEALIRATKAGARLPELALPAMASDSTPAVPAPAPPPGPAMSFPATRRSMWLLLLRGTAVLAVTPIPFLWLLSLGPYSFAGAKGLGMLLLATVVPAFQSVRTRFKLRRNIRGDGQSWRMLDVEIRHRGRALVLVTGSEALRTQLVLRRPPAGRAQVWFAGHIHGDGVVSLRADGAVVPVRCVEKRHAAAKPKAAASGERRRTRRWGRVG
ncbi:hypothetical protein [Streptomyces spongiae]|uniref:Uncharacterized protein n=1 Tax=Streptomyces spongiae TaxID=565072 RepID=A0A5N8XL93_9ACTN|nr:hypothetical protein [Streptomyces spongiae]MPY60229.1 hypothetical protein [Streptomyces spongiae]